MTSERLSKVDFDVMGELYHSEYGSVEAIQCMLACLWRYEDCAEPGAFWYGDRVGSCDGSPAIFMTYFVRVRPTFGYQILRIIGVRGNARALLCSPSCNSVDS